MYRAVALLETDELLSLFRNRKDNQANHFWKVCHELCLSLQNSTALKVGLGLQGLQYESIWCWWTSIVTKSKAFATIKMWPFQSKWHKTCPNSKYPASRIWVRHRFQQNMQSLKHAHRLMFICKVYFQYGSMCKTRNPKGSKSIAQNSRLHKDSVNLFKKFQFLWNLPEIPQTRNIFPVSLFWDTVKKYKLWKGF